MWENYFVNPSKIIQHDRHITKSPYWWLVLDYISYFDGHQKIGQTSVFLKCRNLLRHSLNRLNSMYSIIIKIERTINHSLWRYTDLIYFKQKFKITKIHIKSTKTCWRSIPLLLVCWFYHLRKFLFWNHFDIS